MRTLAIAVLALGLPLLAKAPLQETQIVTSEHTDLAPGGAVRVNGSMGQLDVEGWDQPQVEITLGKSTFRRGTPKGVEDAKQFLNRIQIKVERKSAGELLITTVLPSRNLITRPLRGMTDVSLQYVIKVPRDAHLVIHHDSGDIRLQGLTGPIEAGTHAGDIEMRLPEASPYTIDARCKVGGVYSDFAGDHRVRYAVGERYGHDAASSAPHAVLRVGVGGIQILKTPAVAAAP
ncbi:exported hypothetical protein [Candidatus Sulfopaludibacter sp. SbA4]|nr:exported hypothetical protein [Candidatus Sulfopaludibacter sp. SbA4]